MRLLLLTFGFGVLSASVPVLNMEAYLLVVHARAGAGTLPETLVLALVGSVGQNIGKLLWYYAARGAIDVRFVQRRIETPRRQAQLARWRGQVEGRPARSGVITFVSAAVGFPPFFAISVLAGMLRMNVAVFVVAGVLGRTVFFTLLLLGAGLLLR